MPLRRAHGSRRLPGSVGDHSLVLYARLQLSDAARLRDGLCPAVDARRRQMPRAPRRCERTYKHTLQQRATRSRTRPSAHVEPRCQPSVHRTLTAAACLACLAQRRRTPHPRIAQPAQPEGNPARPSPAPTSASARQQCVGGVSRGSAQGEAVRSEVAEETCHLAAVVVSNVCR